MIQKMSDQNKIKFLEKKDVNPSSEENPKEAKNKEISEIAEEQKARMINNKDNGLMTSKHISSAYTGVIQENGGPSKQVKMETSNTIWQPDRLSNQKEDSQTRVRAEKEQIITNRRVAEQQRMADIVEKLKDTDQRKTSTVSKVGIDQGSNYKAPKNNMSIFDTQDFQRLSEQTEGERISKENSEKKSQKDDSWRGDKKAVNTKDKLHTFIDNLLNNMGTK